MGPFAPIIIGQLSQARITILYAIALLYNKLPDLRQNTRHISKTERNKLSPQLQKDPLVRKGFARY